jgi:hypothetical protein
VKILVTGRGGAGSWTVRGEQIGRTLGAQVKAKATPEDCRNADVILAVKRVPDDLLAAIKASGRPWVYDIVDAYPQPDASEWTASMASRWGKQHVGRLKPDAVIWPNARMRQDCDGGGAVVYHHARPGIERNPIRPRIAHVGYEGEANYLDGWAGVLADECARRGAEFVLNPGSLADLDVVVALRGGRWDGYVQRHWKSNVKLANAHASGTPFIGLPECGYQETAAGCEYWVTTPRELAIALDWLETQDARRAISERFWSRRSTWRTRPARCWRCWNRWRGEAGDGRDPDGQAAVQDRRPDDRRAPRGDRERWTAGGAYDALRGRRAVPAAVRRRRTRCTTRRAVSRSVAVAGAARCSGTSATSATARHSLRVSIDTDHPQGWLDRHARWTAARWELLGDAALREDADPAGPDRCWSASGRSRART